MAQNWQERKDKKKKANKQGIPATVIRGMAATTIKCNSQTNTNNPQHGETKHNQWYPITVAPRYLTGDPSEMQFRNMLAIST